MARNLRKEGRHPISAEGMLYDLQGNSLAQVIIRNISPGGAQIEMTQEIELPLTFLLSLTRHGDVRRSCKKAWQFSTVAGVSFVRP